MNQTFDSILDAAISGLEVLAPLTVSWQGDDKILAFLKWLRGDQAEVAALVQADESQLDAEVNRVFRKWAQETGEATPGTQGWIALVIQTIELIRAWRARLQPAG